MATRSRQSRKIRPDLLLIILFRFEGLRGGFEQACRPWLVFLTLSNSLYRLASMLTSKLPIFTPFRQLLITGLLLFAGPGLYGSITGLGAGGGKPSSAQVANITNCVLYGVYTLCAFVAGSAVNVLGPRACLCVGAAAYPIYASGLWIYDRTGQTVPPILFGGVLGVGAGLLWSAAGFVQYAYADESKKGLYIVIQWLMVAFGSTIGAAIAFGANFSQTDASTGSPNSVYIIFIAIEAISIIFGIFFIVHPRHIRRSDGTAIAIFQAKRTFKEEALDYLKLTKDWKIWALYIIGMSSELCLSFQSTMSAHVYNLRTRSLVSLMFWMIQIPATLALKPIFDANMKRRNRGYIGATFLLVVTIAIWATEIVWLKGPNGITVNEDPLNYDWSDSASEIGSLFAGYMLNGIIYACWQSVVQYVIASLSNDPKICARYAGLFKSAVSAGMTISFGVTAAEVDFLPQAYWQATQQFVSLALLYFVCSFIKETNYFQEKDVIVPTYVDKIVQGRVDVDELRRHAAENTLPQVEARDVEHGKSATYHGPEK